MKYIFTIPAILFCLWVKAQTITDSLHAHYLFNGNLLDQTGNNYDLSVNVGTTNFGIFSGSDQSVICDSTRYSTTVGFNNSYFTAMTMSTWFKCSTTTSWYQVMLQGQSIGFGLHVSTTGTVYAFFDGSSTGSLNSSTVLTDGNWHHMLACNNGTTTTLYIDGVLDGTMSESLYTPSFSSSNVLNVGLSNLMASPYFGELNDMRIYNRVLSTSEINQIYINVPDIVAMDQLAIAMYPNPSNSLVTFEIGQPANEITVSITDAQGRVVAKEQFQQLKKIDLFFDQPAGIYTATVVIDGQMKNFKLIRN